MFLKILGVLIIAWGTVDIVDDWAGMNVWRDVAGVQLHGAMFRISGWAELVFGFLCWTMGNGPNAGRV